MLVLIMELKAIHKREVSEPKALSRKVALIGRVGIKPKVSMTRSMTRKMFGIVECWEGLEEVHEEYESDFHRC